MSCSNPLPPFTYDLLCFLHREQLERFSIICRPLMNLIKRYFHTKPYRVFDGLEIRPGSYALVHNDVQWHPNRGDYSVQQFLDGVVEFQLKCKDGTEESQKLWTFADVREYAQRHTSLQAQDDSSEKSLSESLCILNDVKQKEAIRILEWLLSPCVSAEYEWSENLTISAENIEDLLSIGSYFQISKIMDNCKEFLGRKYDYMDFSVERRTQLVNKYNLTSVRVPSFEVGPPVIPRDRTFKDILVQVNFLDTGNEEMDRVKYENSMTIQSLLSDVFKRLYFNGICEPNFYKLESVRISDPNTPFSTDRQIINIVDNPASIFDFVLPSRIYNFEVRQIAGEIYGFESLKFKATSSMSNEKPSTSYESLQHRTTLAFTKEQSTSNCNSFSGLNNPKPSPRRRSPGNPRSRYNRSSKRDISLRERRRCSRSRVNYSATRGGGPCHQHSESPRGRVSRSPSSRSPSRSPQRSPQGRSPSRSS